MEELTPDKKDLLSVKDMRALGYPERMIYELSSLPGGKSTIRRGGKTSTIYFVRALLLDDIKRYKEVIGSHSSAKDVLTGRTVRIDKDVNLRPRQTMIVEF